MKIKVLIKCIDELDDNYKWMHLCYADYNLYQTFLKTMGISRKDLSVYISKWVKQDFNYDTSMSYRNDIFILRQLIRENYKIAYPELVIDSETDRQGWLRVWLTKHMKQEIDKKLKGA